MSQFSSAAASLARADSSTIVQRLLTTTDGVKQIASEYGCCDRTIWLIYRAGTTRAQRREAASIRISHGRTGKNLGNVPWNKGVSVHLSPETEFKAGDERIHVALRGATRGTVTTRTYEGYEHRWIKVRNDGPKQFRWVRYARYVWEQANGPVPAGYVVRHKDGDTLNDAIENLHLRLLKRCAVSAKSRARANVTNFLRQLDAEAA